MLLLVTSIVGITLAVGAEPEGQPPEWTASQLYEHFAKIPGDVIFKNKLTSKAAKQAREGKDVKATEEYRPKQEPTDAGTVRFYYVPATRQYWMRRVNQQNPDEPDWMAGPFDLSRKQPVPSAAASAAVLLSLNEFFSGVWSFGKIYIEPGQFIPSSLAQVGKYEAEVISEADLKRRFEGKETAPAFARLQVQVVEQKGDTLYQVSISYTGLSIPGAKAIPLGGGKTYKFKIQAGTAVFVESLAVKE